VAEFGEPIVLRIDRSTGGTEAFPVTRPARALAHDGGHIWASMPDEIAVARLAPTAYVTTGNRPERLVYSRGRIYVACRFDDTLVVIDPRRLKRVKRLPMPLNPFAVAAGAGHVWVTSLAKGSVTRVDLGSPASS
jgi:DNA-binding beta-propeller fold protein YncE